MTDIRERRRANNEAPLSLLSYEYCFLRHVLRMQSAMPDCDREAARTRARDSGGHPLCVHRV